MWKELTMTARELMYEIAARAKYLADARLNDLRIAVGTCDTPAASIREHRHRTRGDIIEEILIDEFEGAIDDSPEE